MEQAAAKIVLPMYDGRVICAAGSSNVLSLCSPAVVKSSTVVALRSNYCIMVV